MRSERISAVDSLRGLAALAVAWFHFTNNANLFPIGHPLRSSGKFGWLGVEMFFVISGFVIPYALQRSDYTPSHFGRFVLKRIIRLDPPYLVSIALVLLLAFASALMPGFRGQPPQYSWVQLVLHAGYVNVFFGYPWLNPVYWTLAIELQYYLIVGLAFPFIAKTRTPFAIMLAAAVLLAFCVRSPQLIFCYLPLFGLGILSFRVRVCGEGTNLYCLLASLLFAATWSSLGLLPAVAGVATSAVIAFVEINSSIGEFLGHISYSIYLLHVPFGGRVVNLFTRLPDGSLVRLLAPFAALAVSIAAAHALYRLVERPSQSLAAAVRYTRKETASLVDVGAMDATTH